MSIRGARIVVAVLAGVFGVAGVALATLRGRHHRGPRPRPRDERRPAQRAQQGRPALQTKSSVDFHHAADHDRGGGTTGWHSHPGPVLVTVKAGALTLVYANDPTCAGRTYRAGESLWTAATRTCTRRQPGNHTAELWGTYLVPGHPSAVPARDAPDPGCDF